MPELQSLAMTKEFFPQRVAALQPSATDTLARLGLLERVVACTRYCAEIVPAAGRGRLVIADSWSASMTFCRVSPFFLNVSVTICRNALSFGVRIHGSCAI